MAWKFEYTFAVSRVFGEEIAPSLTLNGGWEAFRLLCESVKVGMPITILTLNDHVWMQRDRIEFDPFDKTISVSSKTLNREKKVIYTVSDEIVKPFNEYLVANKRKAKKKIT